VGCIFQLYQRERINFDHIPFIDNEPILKLIEEKPYGVLNLLDEEVRVPQGSDQKFLMKVDENQSRCKYVFPICVEVKL